MTTSPNSIRERIFDMNNPRPSGSTISTVIFPSMQFRKCDCCGEDKRRAQGKWFGKKWNCNQCLKEKK